MIMTKEQIEKFQELSKPLMKYLCDEFHPHVSVIITPTTAEISSGSHSFQTSEFVKD